MPFLEALQIRCGFFHTSVIAANRIHASALVSWKAWGRFFLPLVVAVAGAIVAYQLFLPPIVGLADDGDFGKIIGQVGLRYPPEDLDTRPYSYVTVTYDITPTWWRSGYLTSEIPLVAVARFYAGGLPARGVFDIRWLGLLHMSIFLASLALLLVGTRTWRPASRLAFTALLVFVFTDVGYAALFNSFYSATASYLALLMLAGIVLCLTSGIRARAMTFAYWVTALALVTSKPQESVLAPLLGLLGFLLSCQGRGPGGRKTSLWLAICLCAAGALYYLRTPLYLRTEALYNDVFFELLLRSPNPRADLVELDLPAEWIAYSGTYAYLPDAPLKDPAFRQEFLRRVGFRKILGFYLRHPSRLVTLLKLAAQRAFRLRQRYLGNFPVSAGGKPRELSRAFGLWSAAKERLGPSGPWLLPLLWLGNLAGSLLVWGRSADVEKRCLATGVAALAGLSVVEFLVCSLAEGIADIARHLHAFNAMTDLLFVTDVVWLVSVAAAVVKTRALATRSATAG